MASPTPLTCKLIFMKRFVVTGAECTGKSTLTKALSAYYSEPWTAEYVRKYVDHIKRELRHEDLEQIAKGQIKEEDAVLLRARRFLIHDTNLLSSIISSLLASFPLESGFVQNTPLALLPVIDSGSPGICVNEIAPKFDTPVTPVKPFIDKTCL